MGKQLRRSPRVALQFYTHYTSLHTSRPPAWHEKAHSRWAANFSAEPTDWLATGRRPPEQTLEGTVLGDSGRAVSEIMQRPDQAAEDGAG
jgi:hypothetical protein